MAEEPDATPIDPSPPPQIAPRRIRWGRWIGYGFLSLWAAVATWNLFKPLPAGVSIRGEIVSTPLADLKFLSDVTGADVHGERVVHQQIFDEMLQIIAGAREYLVLDYFLFNGQRGADLDTRPFRELSIELRDALMARKREVPDLRVLFIADPINDVYGALPSRELAALRGVGIDVVRADLDSLRDSNPVYSALWRLTMRWWSGDGRGEPRFANPLDAGPDRVTFGAWARLLNFKADHRKVLLADDGNGGLTGIVSSANPHDASSLHSNVALRASGPALLPLLESELALARAAGWNGNWELPELLAPAVVSPETTAQVQVLTEGEIGRAVVSNIAATRVGDGIDVAMFYLSERKVVRALIAAAKRGVAVRVILDPNKDAFGHTKNGIPNRSVATELGGAADGAIKVRWFRTHGEQFHSKLVAIRTANEFWFTLGSANLTRRNIGDFNLEANLAASVPLDSELAARITGWFESLWTNRPAPEPEYTAEFGAYADPAQSTYWLYRIMESTGLSTF
ncbi:MAG TPA: phospholipase D-like domain-containing protein [Steroidobacteraceae bacterium]|jgi:phosphatidylserine/phosphatidylglycerophosphate/cardiolipin synthase-like enzyme